MSPHETREFTNSVEYTVHLTFVVAGGARWRTGHARARRIAERLASAAARANGVVDVRAVAGATRDGQLLTPDRVCFAAANSGHGTGADPNRLDRYFDVDRERALVSLAEANAAARVRRQADFDRRLAKTASLDRLLADAVERRRDGRLTPGVLIDLLAETTGSSTVEVVERLADARRAAHDADRTVDRMSARLLSRELPGPEISLR